MTATTKDKLRQIITFFSIVAGVLYVNLSNVAALELLPRTVGEMSRRVPTLFFPAGYAFMIWGVIHAGLIAYAIFQLLPAQRRNPLLRQLAPWVSANVLLSALWCWVYSHEMLSLALVLIVMQLVALAVADVLIHRRPHLSKAERWCVFAPLGLNFGWISVATIANAAQVLAYDLRWDGGPLTPTAWTVVMMGVASALAVIMVVRRDNWPFALAAAWGVLAIAVRFWSRPTLAGASLCFALAVAVAAIAHVARTIASHRHAPLIH